MMFCQSDIVNDLVPQDCWRTYQEHNRYVEQEGDHSIGDQGKQADTVDILHGHGGDLHYQSCHSVHEAADRGEVIERDQGIHLKLGRAEQPLHHHQPCSFEDNATGLVKEACQVELDLADGGNDDSYDDQSNVTESLHAWWCNPKDP